MKMKMLNYEYNNKNMDKTYYNNLRIHTSLKMTPKEFEKLHA